MIHGTINCDLPLTNLTYDGWNLNENHYQVKYHRETVLPNLARLLEFPFNINDFNIEEKKSKEGYDISMLYPVKDFIYTVKCFTTNEILKDIKYKDLVHCGSGTEYHQLYRYGHKCSRLVNKTLENGKTLLISGDSHLIPDIMLMSIYFKEIWYFDNRTDESYSDNFKNRNFDKILLEIGSTKLNRYIKGNLK